MISELFVRGIRLNDTIEEEESYIKDLPVVKNLMKEKELFIKSRVTFFVGENGTGKSTLLEAMAIRYGFNGEGGSQNFRFQTNPTHSRLHEHLTLIKGTKKPSDGFFLRAESFYNVATELEALDRAGPSSLFPLYGGKSLHQQSHGESFMSLIQNRFRGNGLYLLDEPEAALSPIRQMSLITHIRNLIGTGSQFIIATHSPILLSFPGAEIYVLSEEGIELTPYQETEHYIITKEFLDHPEKMLELLLEE